METSGEFTPALPKPLNNSMAMTMNIIILANGRTKPGYWKDITIPKPLIVLGQNDMGENVTILDLQMKVLAQFDVNITFVVGYEKDQIIDHVMENYSLGEYSGFIYDEGWNREYNSARTMLEIEDAIDEIGYPFILLHGDLIFDPALIEYLIKAKGDVVKTISSSWMAIKISQKAYKGFLEVFRRLPKLTSEYGIGTRTLYEIEEELIYTIGPIVVKAFDVDRREDMPHARSVARRRIISLYDKK